MCSLLIKQSIGLSNASTDRRCKRDKYRIAHSVLKSPKTSQLSLSILVFFTHTCPNKATTHYGSLCGVLLSLSWFLAYLYLQSILFDDNRLLILGSDNCVGLHSSFHSSRLLAFRRRKQQRSKPFLCRKRVHKSAEKKK